jgi:putative redox protein
MVEPEGESRAGTAASYAGRWVSARVEAGYRTDVTARTHALTTDEPTSLGGTDQGMNPLELFLASIGACMAMTMRMYADRKGWPLTSARVHLRRAPVRADPNLGLHMAGAPQLTDLERVIELDGPLDDTQRARIIEIADRCPVKRTIEAGIRMVDAAPDAS